MYKKLIHYAVLLIFVFSIGACTAREQEADETVTVLYADYPAYENAEDLIDASDLVFSGRVNNIRYELLDVRSQDEGSDEPQSTASDAIPYSIFEIEVENVYKGEIDSTITYLKRPGGTINGENYVLEGGTDIRIGEAYLFAAKTFEDSYASFINADQSVYLMNPKEAALHTENQSEMNSITLQQILELFDSESPKIEEQ